MNNFKLASRSLFRKGRGNVIKMISLGLGLAAGLILITKVFFEYNYESFYPASDRIYQVVADYVTGEGEDKAERSYSVTPGGVAYDMGREIAQVEAATRYTSTGGVKKIRKSAKEVVNAEIIIADSCLHDVLPRPMLRGDAKRALSTPRGAIVSRSLAEKLGGDVMGQVFELEEYPDYGLTVEGIFEDIPENSDFRYDMAVSMLSMSDFTWDGSLNWVGNDRYTSFLKLRPGVTAEEMPPLMRAVQQRHGEVEELAAAGVDINYRLVPLTSVHTDDPVIRQSNLLMLLLAVSLIAIALLNYLIVTLSTVIGRAREIAVNKCYGADGNDIRRQVLAEAVLHISLSLVAAAVLMAIFTGQVQEILDASLGALFSWQGVAIVAGVCLVLLFIATWVPSQLFVNVPAASVFRNFRRSRKSWKLALLFVQFMYAVTFCAILLVIWRQYNMMVDSDPGYKYENVAWTIVMGTTQSQRDIAIENLRAMPQVEGAAISSVLPFDPQSGNNVFLPGSDQQLFNIADLYWVDENWFGLMEIPVIEGRGFERGVTDPRNDTEMMVSRAFAERISRIAGWDDGVVGKSLIIGEHGERTITGVYENFRVGSAKVADQRPTVLGYTEYYEAYGLNIISVRLREMSDETMRAVQQVLAEAMPYKQINVNATKNSIAGLYNEERIERDSIVLCSIITLLVVLLGLVGYLRNEISRRSAEIAIRKINGAGIGDILKLLVRDILYISVPALAAGSVIAYFVSRRWVSGFAEQITLTPWLYVLSAVAVLAVILAVAVAVSYRISVQNPVDSLKKDE